MPPSTDVCSQRGTVWLRRSCASYASGMSVLARPGCCAHLDPLVDVVGVRVTPYAQVQRVGLDLGVQRGQRAGHEFELVVLLIPAKGAGDTARSAGPALRRMQHGRRRGTPPSPAPHKGGRHRCQGPSHSAWSSARSSWPTLRSSRQACVPPIAPATYTQKFSSSMAVRL
jgi:hypothetical protein